MENNGRKQVASLSLAALGVVFGDIGTSPLYALRECFHGDFGIAVTPANVLGVVSLILWALLLIVSIKYLGFIMRADNDAAEAFEHLHKHYCDIIILDIRLPDANGLELMTRLLETVPNVDRKSVV